LLHLVATINAIIVWYRLKAPNELEKKRETKPNEKNVTTRILLGKLLLLDLLGSPLEGLLLVSVLLIVAIQLFIRDTSSL
jgi:hypothetical protein